MPFELWIAFLAASTVLLVIPGPTILLVVSYALSQGRRVAVAMALGVALGDLIAMSASLLGLGALVLASATLFTALKWLGGGYLVWLGIKLWRSPPLLDIGTAPPKSATAVFIHAAMVTALNPKSITFFIAFVPQFVRLDAPLGPQFSALIAGFVSLAALNALCYALLADRLRARLGRRGMARNIGRASAGALIGMGALAVLSKRG